RLDGDGVRPGGAADDQGGLAGVGRVGLQGRGGDRVLLRGGGAGAAVLVRGGHLDAVGAAGGVDVAHPGARPAADGLGGAVARGDREGEAGRLAHAGRVVRREGEGAGRAADAIGRAGHARRGGHVVDGQGEGGRGRKAAGVRGRECHRGRPTGAIGG